MSTIIQAKSYSSLCSLHLDHFWWAFHSVISWDILDLHGKPALHTTNYLTHWACRQSLKNQTAGFSFSYRMKYVIYRNEQLHFMERIAWRFRFLFLNCWWPVLPGVKLENQWMATSSLNFVYQAVYIYGYTWFYDLVCTSNITKKFGDNAILSV